MTPTPLIPHHDPQTAPSQSFVHYFWLWHRAKFYPVGLGFIRWVSVVMSERNITCYWCIWIFYLSDHWTFASGTSGREVQEWERRFFSSLSYPSSSEPQVLIGQAQRYHCDSQWLSEPFDHTQDPSARHSYLGCFWFTADNCERASGARKGAVVTHIQWQLGQLRTMRTRPHLLFLRGREGPVSKRSSHPT